MRTAQLFNLSAGRGSIVMVLFFLVAGALCTGTAAADMRRECREKRPEILGLKDLETFSDSVGLNKGFRLDLFPLRTEDISVTVVFSDSVIICEAVKCSGNLLEYCIDLRVGLAGPADKPRIHRSSKKIESAEISRVMKFFLNQLETEKPRRERSASDDILYRLLCKTDEKTVLHEFGYKKAVPVERRAVEVMHALYYLCNPEKKIPPPLVKWTSSIISGEMKYGKFIDSEKNINKEIISCMQKLKPDKNGYASPGAGILGL